MGRKPGARSKRREQKLRKREKTKRLQKARSTAARSRKERMRRAGRWPLLECRICSGFREKGQAQVVIAREGPGEIAVGVFLVDLGCMGVKDCFALDDLSPEAYEELTDGLAEMEPFETCDAALAVKVVQTGVEYAAGLGFRPCSDYAEAREIFGDVDPGTCREEIPCGHDGKPFYVMGPEDDADQILLRLEQRLGPDGFHYLVEGLDEDLLEDDFPGEDDPDPDERLWGRMRRAESGLIETLVEFALDRRGHRFFRKAWAEFDSRGVFDGDEEYEDDGAFLPWALFNHVPRRRKGFAWRRLGETRPVALDFLAEQGERLDPFERRFLETVCRIPYSFHVVESAEAGRTLGLRDVFTGRTHVVRDRLASEMAEVGEVIFGRVLEVDSVAILVGMGSFRIPASFRIELIDVRDDLVGEGGFLTEEAVLDRDRSFRELYLGIVERVLRPPAPQLSNTDGEPLVFCHVFFDLSCPAAEALEELKDLALDWTDEDFREEAVLDDAGELERIEFPWLVRGNEVHRSWGNTVLGRLTLGGRELVIEVNSEARAERVRREVERRLGARVAYRATERESPEKLLAESRCSQCGEPEAAPDAARDTVVRDPLARAELERVVAAHWEDWVDTELPALGDRTPREAARTAAGRERVAALLDDFGSSRPGGDLPGPDVEGLRRELGLSRERCTEETPR